MPRVNPYFKPPFERLSRLIKGYSSAREIADKLGVCYETARTRLKHPETLTLKELREISIKLHIPKEELMEAIKW